MPEYWNSTLGMIAIFRDANGKIHKDWIPAIRLG